MAKREMTEEQKKAAAERLAKARAAKAEAKAKEAEVKEEKAVEAESAKEVKAEENAVQPIIQVVAPKDPDVKILYIDSAIQENEIPIGGGRVITGSGRIFTVSLANFEGEFQNPFRMKLLANRKFIVLDGLTQEQRELYNCDYKDGEVIKSEGTFDFLFRCPIDKAVEVFSNLCKEHRELVGKRFVTAYEAGDNRITRDRVEALNEISKKDYENGEGIFTEIIKSINKKI